MTDDRIRAAYEALVAARAPATRDGCPPPESLLAVVTHTGPEAERLVTVNHALGCAACRPELELLRSIAIASARPVRLRVTAVASLAAAVVVAVSLGVLTLRRTSTIERGQAVTPVEGVANDTVFMWHRVSGAVDYHITVATASGTLVRDTVTRDTVLAVPHMDAGREYYWIVRARLSDGTERAMAPLKFRARK
jgi:molybdopterin-binding protein